MMGQKTQMEKLEAENKELKDSLASAQNTGAVTILLPTFASSFIVF